METLLAIAVKSLLIAGLTLAILALMKKRSAAERSWVAHIGLLALIIMAFAPLVLPSWTVEAPALLGHAPAVEAPALAPAPTAKILPGTGRWQSRVSGTDGGVGPSTIRSTADGSPPRSGEKLISAAAAASAVYAIPAAILLFITFLALTRLIALRARAEVLVDAKWLTALARAQRRMGFKHGTALLTSNALASPISWGLMRPVILLNTRAVEASDEAEAIIAHELAHVARMDWAKLLLARIATALFWFNPLVWLLAREAHQLREETADDAVLAADIADTDYAQLLVGVARHECPGLLLGAHGVAPSKSSLARRVARVLDGKSVRGPAARGFAAGVFAGAVLVAAPLAALTLTPGGPKLAKPAPAAGQAQHYYGRPSVTAAPADLPHIIASGVSTSVATVEAAVNVNSAEEASDARADAVAEATERAKEARDRALEKVAAANEKVRAAMSRVSDDRQIDAIVQMKAAGITPEYVREMQAISPRLRATNPANFAGIKSLGVSPEYARDLAAAGFRDLDANDLAEARAVGLTGEYARAVASAGVPLDLDDYVQLRAVGVPADYIVSIRRSGHAVRDADKIVEMWSVGVRPEDLRISVQVPRPPITPPPSRRGLPAAAPPHWTTPRPPQPPQPPGDPDGG